MPRSPPFAAAAKKCHVPLGSNIVPWPAVILYPNRGHDHGGSAPSRGCAAPSPQQPSTATPHPRVCAQRQTWENRPIGAENAPGAAKPVQKYARPRRTGGGPTHQCFQELGNPGRINNNAPPGAACGFGSLSLRSFTGSNEPSLFFFPETVTKKHKSFFYLTSRSV